MTTEAVDPWPPWWENKPTESALHTARVTPSDSEQLPYLTKGISWGVDGDIVVLTAAGNITTIETGELAVGVCHPMKIKQVLSTGTTAQKIRAWFR